MRRLLALLALTLGPALASGGPDDPIRWLRQEGQVGSARFLLAHATYSVWQLRWQGQDLRLTFASNARTAQEAGQLRELTVEAVGSGKKKPTLAQQRAVTAAARVLAAHCGLKTPAGPETQRALTLTLPSGARPACLVPTP